MIKIHIISYLNIGGYMMEDYMGFRPTLAVADILGSDKYTGIKGRVIFKQKGDGVVVTAEIMGLPLGENGCNRRIFGFHIHECNSCTGNEKDPFMNVKGHYNPDECEHPSHAGDLPPLFGNNGYAYLSVYTDRFTISEIIGRTVILHSMADDFNTPPSGNAGEKIACGKIKVI